MLAYVTQQKDFNVLLMQSCCASGMKSDSNRNFINTFIANQTCNMTVTVFATCKYGMTQ